MNSKRKCFQSSLICLALASILACSMPHDFGHGPPNLQTICIQWEAQDGYLYQRQAMFASHKAAEVLDTWKHSHQGACNIEAAGQGYKVPVCLVASSPCAHDRTTHLWADEVDKYLERYPGSHRGACTSECSRHKDDCLERLDQFHRPSDIRQWLQWMREMQLTRRPGGA